jgi:4,5-dihydroxyphthalate decarboxylase
MRRGPAWAPAKAAGLTRIGLPVVEVVRCVVRFAEFGVAEMSLSSYLLSLPSGVPFAALPAFPSRMARLVASKPIVKARNEKRRTLPDRPSVRPNCRLTATAGICQNAAV